jgi:hypothetical protein
MEGERGDVLPGSFSSPPRHRRTRNPRTVRGDVRVDPSMTCRGKRQRSGRVDKRSPPEWSTFIAPRAYRKGYLKLSLAPRSCSARAGLCATASVPLIRSAAITGPAWKISGKDRQRTEGRTTTAQQVARSIRLLETLAEHAADEFAWPAPFTLKMQSCGYPNARWDLPTHKLTMCYELAPEFADIYRTYADVRADGSATADGSKRKTIGASAFRSNRQQIHHNSSSAIELREHFPLSDAG